jgi:hypothetical protein
MQVPLALNPLATMCTISRHLALGRIWSSILAGLRSPKNAAPFPPCQFPCRLRLCPFAPCLRLRPRVLQSQTARTPGASRDSQGDTFVLRGMLNMTTLCTLIPMRLLTMLTLRVMIAVGSTHLRLLIGSLVLAVLRSLQLRTGG